MCIISIITYNKEYSCYKAPIFMKKRGLFFEHIHKILANINHIYHVYSYNAFVIIYLDVNWYW